MRKMPWLGLGFASLLVCAAAITSQRLIKNTQSAEDAAVHSVAASMCVELAERGTKALPAQGYAREWHILSGEQYDAVMAFLIKNRAHLDACALDEKTGNFIDYWGNEFVVAGKALSNGELLFAICSKGRDGIFATQDDICAGDWEDVRREI